MKNRRGGIPPRPGPDRGKQRGKEKTSLLQQILGLDRHNFSPVSPVIMVLVSVRSLCRELPTNACLFMVCNDIIKKLK